VRKPVRVRPGPVFGLLSHCVRRTSRRLDDIVDTVYERLQPLIRRRDETLPDNEVAAAIEAVAETLESADLSDPAVFGDDVDPALMGARLRRQLPAISARATTLRPIKTSLLSLTSIGLPIWAYPAFRSLRTSSRTFRR
jgi:hypothetical protein